MTSPSAFKMLWHLNSYRLLRSLNECAFFISWLVKRIAFWVDFFRLNKKIIVHVSYSLFHMYWQIYYFLGLELWGKDFGLNVGSLLYLFHMYCLLAPLNFLSSNNFSLEMILLWISISFSLDTQVALLYRHQRYLLNKLI